MAFWLVQATKKVIIRKIPTLATVEYTDNIFWINNLIEQWDSPSDNCSFWGYWPLDVVMTPPGLYMVAVSPVE